MHSVLLASLVSIAALGKPQVDEHRTHVAGAALSGASRTVSHDRTVFFELLRIETRPGGVFSVAQPRGEPATGLQLTTVDTHSATSRASRTNFPSAFAARARSTR